MAARKTKAKTKNPAALKPPATVATQARRGLKLREQFGRGGTSIGVARARDLMSRRTVSVQTLRRMGSYFARHVVDRKSKQFSDRANPSAGYIAWLLWGGDAGRAWAERKLKALQKTPLAKADSGAMNKVPKGRTRAPGPKKRRRN